EKPDLVRLFLRVYLSKSLPRVHNPTMISADDLINDIRTYKDSFDPTLVTAAYEYAKVKHEGQFRSSGEPYYTHPMEVAQILTGFKMDVATILTAILHDTLEDTDATYEELEKKFGKDVAELVNGVS